MTYSRLICLYYALILLIGCSVGPGTPPLLMYVKRFEHECKRLVTIPVLFADLQGRSAGNCQIRGGIRRIYIDYKEWMQYSDLGKEQLVFHELGHCVLNRYKHDDTFIQIRGVLMPRSIMYPVVFGYTEAYEENREYYVKELCR